MFDIFLFLYSHFSKVDSARFFPSTFARDCSLPASARTSGRLEKFCALAGSLPNLSPTLAISFYMKFSNLIRHKRRKFHHEDKEIYQDVTASFFNDLTSTKVTDRIKADKQVYKVDEEGNIKEIPTDKTKKIKLAKNRKSFDLVNLGLSYYLVTPLIFGVFSGLALDYWLKTKPLFFIFFLFLGTLASFYNIFKILKER